MYTTKRHCMSVGIEEYLDGYVNIEEFLTYCQTCPNYQTFWACPPFDFSRSIIGNSLKPWTFMRKKLSLMKPMQERNLIRRKWTVSSTTSLKQVKKQLTEELYEIERQTPGSVSLSAGSCELCQGNCTRKDKEACRFPDKMRYSIEALGGNVGLTINKLMGIELEWIREGVLPGRFVLVCGLLRNSK